MLRRSFTLGALAFAALFVLSAVANFQIVDTIRVGGGAYQSIVRDKDLVADILPPPAYVIEANLEASQAFIGPDDVDRHSQRLTELRRQYADRMAFWAASDLPADIKATLAEKVDRPAQAFWVAVEQGLIPALKRGDPAASAAAYDEVQAAYRDHRQGVDTAVRQATDLQKLNEAEAVSVGAAGDAAMAVGALILLGVLGLAIVLLIRTVFAPLGGLTQTLTAMSQGRTDVALGATSRKDELGAISRAVIALQDLIVARMREASIGAADAAALMVAAKRN